MRNPFRYFKTSPEVIRLAVMMYIRFPLSLRQVEDLLHERGIDICHETVRFWWNRFPPVATQKPQGNAPSTARAKSAGLPAKPGPGKTWTSQARPRLPQPINSNFDRSCSGPPWTLLPILWTLPDLRCPIRPAGGTRFGPMLAAEIRMVNRFGPMLAAEIGSSADLAAVALAPGRGLREDQW